MRESSKSSIMQGIIESTRSTAHQIKLKLQGSSGEVALWKRRFTSQCSGGRTSVQQALLDAGTCIPVLAPGVSVILARDTSSHTNRAVMFCVLSLDTPSTLDSERLKSYTSAISAWVSLASRDILSRAEWWLVPAHVRREMLEETRDRGSGKAADIVREALALIRSAVNRVNIRASLERDLPDGHAVCGVELDTLAAAIECYASFRRDPFATTYVGAQFRTLDMFARAYGVSTRARGIAAVSFKLRLLLADGGHACCSVAGLAATPLLDWTSEDVVTSVTEGALTGALLLVGQDVYLPSVYRTESGVGERVRRFLHAKGGAWSDPARKQSARAALAAGPHDGLDDVQHGAVLQALTGEQGITVISGYPGTGKSRVSRAVLDTCRGMGLNALACAPTAKAASRLGGGATTVHRLLGAVPGMSLMQSSSKASVDADLVLVDEVSMMDMNVAHALLVACDPLRTRLVLVGDANQLPSVEWGDLLGSLMEANSVPRVFLETIYRQQHQTSESTIWALAKSIADGGPLLRSDLRSKSVSWVSDTSLSGVSAALLALRIEHGERMQIISPSRKHGLHTGVLNAIVLGRTGGGASSSLFLAGDRVVVTKNQKATQLRNGDCGTVSSSSKSGVSLVSLRLDDGRTGSLPSCDLDHAYALTIHKAQGSEYAVVALVLSEQQGRALNRQALYTAVSRAVERLYIFASRELLARCVENVSTKRRGHLRDWVDQGVRDSANAYTSSSISASS